MNIHEKKDENNIGEKEGIKEEEEEEIKKKK